MELKKLKKALAAEAQAAGICSEWYNFILKATSKERLMALYFKGFDFVEENDFPSEPLRREFDVIRRHYNIYEAERFSVKNPRRLVAYTGAQGSAEFTNTIRRTATTRRFQKVSLSAASKATAYALTAKARRRLTGTSSR